MFPAFSLSGRRILLGHLEEVPTVDATGRCRQQLSAGRARSRRSPSPIRGSGSAGTRRNLGAAATGGLDVPRPPQPAPLRRRQGHITPLFKAQPGDQRLDRTSGELHPLRFEPDAALHFEDTGETAWGTKFVLVAARGERERSRMILDIDHVNRPGAEAAVAMACLEGTAPLTPGAQGVVYDTALRGVHHQQILRQLGLIPINRVTAAAGTYRWYNEYALPDDLGGGPDHRPPPRQRPGRQAQAQPHREPPAHPTHRPRLR
jgi:hypothetical protein